jgi:Ankyrin repeats (3 copies)
MTRQAMILVAIATVSCSRVQTPPYGGAPEEALVAATVAHDAVRVQQLLAAGSDPNKAITYKAQSQSAWSLALERFTPKQDRQAQVDIVQAMLKSGADPEAAWGTNGGDSPQELSSVGRRSFSSRLPLELAMYSGDPAVVGAILRVKPNAAGGETALVMAIERGETEVAHLLVDAGVDVNSRRGANTPLLAAIEARDAAMMTYLEQHGAREKP